MPWLTSLGGQLPGSAPATFQQRGSQCIFCPLSPLFLAASSQLGSVERQLLREGKKKILFSTFTTVHVVKEEKTMLFMLVPSGGRTMLVPYNPAYAPIMDSMKGYAPQTVRLFLKVGRCTCYLQTHSSFSRSLARSLARSFAHKQQCNYKAILRRHHRCWL
jgi:hypothetical protein